MSSFNIKKPLIVLANEAQAGGTDDEVRAFLSLYSIAEVDAADAALQTQVTTVSGDLDTLEVTVTDLSTDVVTISGDLDALETDVATISASLGELDYTTEALNYTVVDADMGGVVYTTGSGTLTLPATPVDKDHLWIKNKATNSITIDGNGKTIEEETTQTLPSNSSYHLHYDGTEWWVI